MVVNFVKRATLFSTIMSTLHFFKALENIKLFKLDFLNLFSLLLNFLSWTAYMEIKKVEKYILFYP